MLPMIKKTYFAKAIGCGFGTSKNNSTQIGVQMEIVENPEFAGESITWLGHFTEKTQDRTIESLQHLGWKGDDLSELEALDADGCASLLPEIVEIVCEPDTYDNKTTLKVQWVNKRGAGRFTFKEPLTGQNLKAFAAQMKNTIRGAQAAGPQRKQPAAAPSNGGAQRSLPNASHPNALGGTYEGDDIPF